MGNTLYEKMYNVVRPLVGQADITNQKDDVLEFNFLDPIYGRVKYRMYSHEGAAVLTSWENREIFGGGSMAYVYEAETKPEKFKEWETRVVSYLSNPCKFYEEPMYEEWRYIEEQLSYYVKKWGTSVLISKIINVPYFTDEEKVKLLSYLELTDSVKKAKEREALWEITKQTDKSVSKAEDE